MKTKYNLVKKLWGGYSNYPLGEYLYQGFDWIRINYIHKTWWIADAQMIFDCPSFFIPVEDSANVNTEIPRVEYSKPYDMEEKLESYDVGDDIIEAFREWVEKLKEDWNAPIPKIIKQRKKGINAFYKMLKQSRKDNKG